MAGEWYYKVLGQEAGPMSGAELKDLAESGFLGPDVLVRKGADGDWIPAGQVGGLFGGTPEPEAPAPPKPPPADARRKAKASGDAGAGPAQAAKRPVPPEPPPPAPQPADADWYCRAMGKEIGPLSRSALQELAASGFLAPGVPVRQGIDGPWVPASEVKGLLDQTPAPRPAEEPQRPGGEPASPGPEAPTDNRSEPSEKAPHKGTSKPAVPHKGTSQPAAPHKGTSKPPASQGGWYCQVMGEETGPLSSAELKELAATGFLTPDVPVRKGVAGNWVPASRVKGLFPQASQAPGQGKRGSPPASKEAVKPTVKVGPHAPADRASPKPARPQPPTAQIGWYYQAMGQDTGPLSPADLKELAKSGLLTPDMPVRIGADGEWLPASQVLGLFDEPSEAAPAPKSGRAAGPAGGAPRPPAKSVPKPTRTTAVGPGPRAPARPPKKAAPTPPSRPSARPAARPAAPAVSQPAGASGLGDFLEEALAEPAPGGSKADDVYATLPVEPVRRPSRAAGRP